MNITREQLLSWATLQRRRYRDGKLSIPQRKKLEACGGWVWSPRPAMVGRQGSAITSQIHHAILKELQLRRKTVPEIAKQFKVSIASVEKIKYAHGIRTYGREAPKGFRGILNQAETLREACEKLDTSSATLHKWVDAAGVKWPFAPPAMNKPPSKTIIAEYVKGSGLEHGAKKYKLSLSGFAKWVTEACTALGLVREEIQLRAGIRVCGVSTEKFKRFVSDGLTDAEIAEKCGMPRLAVKTKRANLGLCGNRDLFELRLPKSEVLRRAATLGKRLGYEPPIKADYRNGGWWIEFPRCSYANCMEPYKTSLHTFERNKTKYHHRCRHRANR